MHNMWGVDDQRSGQVVVYGFDTGMGYTVCLGALVCRMVPLQMQAGH